MSSTNKTTNLELSQFLGTDKPAWLTDYNADMSKIDTAVHSAQASATGADGKADANSTAIGTLASLTTDVKTSLVSAINEVDGHADTAQGTANSALTKATTNEQSIGTIAGILNLNTTNTYTSATLTASGGTLGAGELYVSRNSDGSLFKVYGNILLTTTALPAQEIKITIPNTGVASQSAYTIVGCGYSFVMGSNGNKYIHPLSINVGTDGTLEMVFYSSEAGVLEEVRPVACLYFNSDFGNIQPSA